MTEYLVDVATGSEGSHYVLKRCPICEQDLADVDDCSLNCEEMAEIVEEHILEHDPSDLNLDDEYYFQPMADILLELHDLGQERKGAV